MAAQLQDTVSVSLAIQRLEAELRTGTLLPTTRQDVAAVVDAVKRLNSDLRKAHLAIRQARGCVKAAHERLEAAEVYHA